jgi:hypothetical protein
VLNRNIVDNLICSFSVICSIFVANISGAKLSKKVPTKVTVHKVEPHETIAEHIEKLQKRYCDVKRKLCSLTQNGSLSEVYKEFNNAFEVLFQLGQVGEKTNSMNVKRYRACAKKYLSENFGLNYQIDYNDGLTAEMDCEQYIETLVYVTFGPLIDDMSSTEIDEIRDEIELEGEQFIEGNSKSCFEQHMIKNLLLNCILKVLMLSELKPNGHQFAIFRKEFLDQNMVAYENYKKCVYQ